MIADLQGYVRINLRGRETGGIVEPGREYDDLCERISSGLCGFVDVDNGQRIVEEVARSEAIYPNGSRRDALPDLLVRWADSPAARHRAVRSDRYGDVAWPTPGRDPTGRSGNHRPEGFLIAAGERIAPCQSLAKAHILDLAPTVYALFGCEPPSHMQGKAIERVARAGSIEV